MSTRQCMRSRIFTAGLTGLFLVVMVLPSLRAEELEWPRDIESQSGTITIYQPQPETFKGDRLTARAAISYIKKDETEPVFGAVWFDARVSTDREARTVKLIDVKVPNAKFPDADPEKVKKLEGILNDAFVKWDPEISLDRLLTSLEVALLEEKNADHLETKPPKIRYVSHPAVLVTIDGEPELRKVENSTVMKVVNTPFFIVLDPDNKTYYLKGGDGWLEAEDVMGPWKTAGTIPSQVKVAATLDKSAPQDSAPGSGAEKMPEIIVATRPTELICSDGKATFSPVQGTELLYMSNTESDLFMEIGSQKCFVLLSGRWYSGDSVDGPWYHVPADKLPADFAKIPADSEKANVLAQVAGTDEARDAVLDTYVPQTASIDRGTATLEVDYDGEPKFEPIEGTGMYYALNTSFSVIRIGDKYYCCQDAVWFVADGPTGPWLVCVEVPEVIYTVPPSSPVYHVRFVHVYRYTPTVVYVGYTPGYVGCYSYGGVVVYGTGYYYRPWHGRYYWPRPHTWGVAVRYNPHTGNWGFAVGHRGAYGGWVRVGVGSGHGHGWWGAGGYRHADIDVDRNINVNRGDINIDNSRNIYNRRNDVARPGERDQKTAETIRRQPSTKPARSNNVFADRDGNVHRKTEKGWEQRSKSGWTKSATQSLETRKPTTTRRSATPSRSTTTSRSRSSLDRAHQSRQRGASRTNTYKKSYGGRRRR